MYSPCSGADYAFKVGSLGRVKKFLKKLSSKCKFLSKTFRICYAVNILNSFCYMFTFAMNQPFLLMPSSFALFRGVLRNRFGVVSW